MSRHLALTGMMGSGKTTVGDLVAARLGRPFVDTDAAVEAAAGRSIDAIFTSEGEATFRAFERDVVAAACVGPTSVIALGGGAVTVDGNVRALREHAFTVLLEVPVDVLAERVGDGSGRPLIGDDIEADLRRLAAERRGRYEEVADVVVRSNGTPAEVAVAVLAAAGAAPGVLTDAERAVLP